MMSYDVGIRFRHLLGVLKLLIEFGLLIPQDGRFRSKRDARKGGRLFDLLTFAYRIIS